MAIFPLEHPLDGMKLIAAACRLYKISLLRLLPLLVLVVFIYHLFRFGDHYLPKAYVNLYHQVSWYVLILWIPMVFSIFSKLDKISRDQSFSGWELCILTAQRFITLMVCLVSILLFPAIILAIGIIVNLVLGKYHAPFLVFMIWNSVLCLLLFAISVNKLFAPILVVTHQQDANNAIDKSTLLVKGFYWRTFGYSLYAILLLVFLCFLPTLFNALLPIKQLPFYITEGIGELLLLLIGPWSFALMLTQLQDLISRKKIEITFS